jgi:hypothetical protein
MVVVVNAIMLVVVITGATGGASVTVTLLDNSLKFSPEACDLAVKTCPEVSVSPEIDQFPELSTVVVPRSVPFIYK